MRSRTHVCRDFLSVDGLRNGSTSTIWSMRTPRRRLSPEDRRAELLALGAEVFGQRPYDDVRIDEIAERAGVSRALMYHYFPDKRAFFAAVVKGQDFVTAGAAQRRARFGRPFPTPPAAQHQRVLCARRQPRRGPNSTSSASGFLMCSLITRAIGRAPISSSSAET